MNDEKGRRSIEISHFLDSDIEGFPNLKLKSPQGEKKTINIESIPMS